jgi:hypothetical protein
MHDLGDNASALGVHRLCHVLPAFELLGRDQARLAGESPAGMAGVCAFRDDQAEGCALPVVLDNQRAGHAGRSRPNARQGRHDHPVGQFQLTEGQRGKKIHK